MNSDIIDYMKRYNYDVSSLQPNDYHEAQVENNNIEEPIKKDERLFISHTPKKDDNKPAYILNKKNTNIQNIEDIEEKYNEILGLYPKGKLNKRQRHKIKNYTIEFLKYLSETNQTNI